MNLAAIAAVAAGGALGAVARYLVALWLPARPGAMPWGTLTVNVVGTLALAVIAALALAARPLPSHAALLLGTGFCGAMTTFSTFSVEAVVLARDGHASTAAIYVGLNLGLCVVAAWIAFTVIAGRSA